jgi:hypothetical protein
MKFSRGELLAGVIALGCAIVVGFTQPKYQAEIKKLRYRTDVLELPPPAHLEKLALGYKSALVDLLWAKILVEQGLHFQDHRRFEALPSYIDGIIALEPTYKPIYDFVDTLILFQYVPGTEADARMARKYLEEGTKARPFDPNVWLHYGQFIAFLAPSYLKDKAEIDRWRVDGANAIARAVDLGADADRSLAATSILDKAGEHKAAIQQLQRSYAITDDPETRRQIRLKLQKMNATVEAEESVGRVEEIWRDRYPFLSRGEVLLVGPPVDAAACAGVTGHVKGCAHDWH